MLSDSGKCEKSMYEVELYVAWKSRTDLLDSKPMSLGYHLDWLCVIIINYVGFI